MGRRAAGAVTPSLPCFCCIFSDSRLCSRLVQVVLSVSITTFPSFQFIGLSLYLAVLGLKMRRSFYHGGYLRELTPLANSLTWHTPSQIAPAVKCSSYYNEDYMILPCQEDSWERGFKTREMGNENTLNWTIADCDAVSPQCTVSTLKWNTPCGIFFCVWMNGKEKVAENGSLVFGMT